MYSARSCQVQYRMHPLIREWPSSQFYSDRLQDPFGTGLGELGLFECRLSQNSYSNPPLMLTNSELVESKRLPVRMACP